MASQEDSSTPSFVTGFGLGLIAGAAGFVLFGTERGKALRKDLQKAFTEAYQEEIAAGEVAGEAVSLREFLATAFSKVKEELEMDAGEAKKIRDQSKSKTKVKSAKTKAANTKSKFKNT